jgi:hypothetical protein
LIELILIKNEKQIINIGYSMAQSSPYDFDIYACLSGYQPRNPKASAYYTCVENHFEGLEQVCESNLDKLWASFQFILGRFFAFP